MIDSLAQKNGSCFVYMDSKGSWLMAIFPAYDR